jgi:hypothetical protein
MYLYICSVDSVLTLFHSASGSTHDITLHAQSSKGPDRDLHHAAPIADMMAGFPLQPLYQTFISVRVRRRLKETKPLGCGGDMPPRTRLQTTARRSYCGL